MRLRLAVSAQGQKTFAAAIEASGNKLTGEILSGKTEQEISDTYRTLDDDFYATARNALVVNANAVARTVMDQARGMGEGRSAEVDNGRARIWAAGIRSAVRLQVRLRSRPHLGCRHRSLGRS